MSVLNARSLAPKLTSLIENFEEREWSFSVITETWFVEGNTFTASVTDLEHGHNIGAVCQNRKNTVGRNTGGGVAVLFNKKKMAASSFPFKRNGCELLICKAKPSTSTQHLYIIAA